MKHYNHYNYYSQKWRGGGKKCYIKYFSKHIANSEKSRTFAAEKEKSLGKVVVYEEKSLGKVMVYEEKSLGKVMVYEEKSLGKVVILYIIC